MNAAMQFIWYILTLFLHTLPQCNQHDVLSILQLSFSKVLAEIFYFYPRIKKTREELTRVTDWLTANTKTNTYPELIAKYL